MTDRAGHGFAGAAILDERLTFFDAPGRNVCREARMWIALRHSRLILRQRYDAKSNRLHSTARLSESHAAATNEGFRNHARFHDLRPHIRLKRREPLARLLNFVVG